MKLLILIAVFSVFVNAQESSNINFQISKNPVDCSLYLLQKKEDLNRVLFAHGEGEIRIEMYAKRFLEQCPNSVFRDQAQDDLKKALEIRAEHNLVIAKYYLKLHEEQKKGLKGAWSRFREIVQKYPSYSKMDEVLFSLVKIELYQNEAEEAKRYYRRILDEFPFSNYVCEANKLFNPPPAPEKDR